LAVNCSVENNCCGCDENIQYKLYLPSLITLQNLDGERCRVIKARIHFEIIIENSMYLDIVSTSSIICRY